MNAMKNKPLYRLPTQGKVAGVGAGLAEYLEVDVTAMRIALLAVIIFTGVFPGILFYFLAAWLMPVKGEGDGKEHKA